MDAKNEYGIVGLVRLWRHGPSDKTCPGLPSWNKLYKDKGGAAVLRWLPRLRGNGRGLRTASPYDSPEPCVPPDWGRSGRPGDGRSSTSVVGGTDTIGGSGSEDPGCDSRRTAASKARTFRRRVDAHKSGPSVRPRCAGSYDLARNKANAPKAAPAAAAPFNAGRFSSLV